jgi:hypothetical protein
MAEYVRRILDEHLDRIDKKIKKGKPIGTMREG